MQKHSKTVKTAVSLPETVFHDAEDAAQTLGLNRSQLYAQALSEFLARRSDLDVTKKLDEVYADESGEENRLDGRLEAMQAAALPRESW